MRWWLIILLFKNISSQGDKSISSLSLLLAERHRSHFDFIDSQSHCLTSSLITLDVIQTSPFISPADPFMAMCTSSKYGKCFLNLRGELDLCGGEL